MATGEVLLRDLATRVGGEAQPEGRVVPGSGLCEVVARGHDWVCPPGAAKGPNDAFGERPPPCDARPGGESKHAGTADGEGTSRGRSRRVVRWHPRGGT